MYLNFKKKQNKFSSKNINRTFVYAEKPLNKLAGHYFMHFYL